MLTFEAMVHSRHARPSVERLTASTLEEAQALALSAHAVGESYVFLSLHEVFPSGAGGPTWTHIHGKWSRTAPGWPAPRPRTR